MSSDLHELKERVEFARSELTTLERESDTFIDASINIFSKPTPLRNTLDIYATCTNDVPVSFRSRAGTIANELRSVLDGLACTLAIRNGKSPNDTYFPISKSAEIFASDGTRKMRKLSAADQCIISSLDPFKGGNNPLFQLHEADRKRKHLRLAASTADTAYIGVANTISIANSNATLSKCYFDGIFVSRLDVFGLNKLYLASPDNGTLLLSGLPANLGVKLFFRIVYLSPDDLIDVGVVKSIDGWIKIVDQILDRFN